MTDDIKEKINNLNVNVMRRIPSLEKRVVNDKGKEDEIMSHLVTSLKARIIARYDGKTINTIRMYFGIIMRFLTFHYTHDGFINARYTIKCMEDDVKQKDKFSSSLSFYIKCMDGYVQQDR